MKHPQPNIIVREYLSKIGAKGGKVQSPAQASHLAKIQSKGGQTVTATKRAHLARALAARWAKAKLAKQATPTKSKTKST